MTFGKESNQAREDKIMTYSKESNQARAASLCADLIEGYFISHLTGPDADPLFQSPKMRTQIMRYVEVLRKVENGERFSIRAYDVADKALKVQSEL